MSRRSRRGAVDACGAGPRAAVADAFVELLRPSAGRELVLEVEGRDGARVRLTLRDGGRWRLAALGDAGQEG
jgi:hypothetical protein